MVTQVSSRNAVWLDGIAVAAQDLRLEQVAAMLTSAGTSGTTGIAATQGVRPSVGSPLACAWTSGMSFTLAAGTCFVQGTVSATAGLYELLLDTTATLTCTASDPANPRIDSVIAVVVDNGNNTSTSVFKILPGTPAGSPAAPTLPANALRLANITVGAAVSTLSAGVFSDQRVWTVACGGILPYGNAALGTAVGGPAGAYVDDLNTGRLRRLDSSGNARAPKTTAFAPVSTTITTNTTIPVPASTVTVGSISITTDGVTEVMLTAAWEGFQSVTPTVGLAVQIYIAVDGTKIGPAATWIQENANNYEAGAGNILAFTAPSAGTHTVSLVAYQWGVTNGNITMINSTGDRATVLRAAPAAN